MTKKKQLAIGILVVLLSLLDGVFNTTTANTVVDRLANKLKHGFNLYLNRETYTSETDLTHKIQNLLYHLNETRINSLIITWPIYTHNNYSSYVFTDKGTPSKQEISLVTRLVKQEGYEVIYKPILDEASIVAHNPNYWRGTIVPRNINTWFTHYNDLILQYAKLAELNSVEGFIIGTELTSMEQYYYNWLNLIQNVKTIFSGYITYASNRGISDIFPWEELDFIGIDAFFEVPFTPNPTEEYLTNYLQLNWVNLIIQKAQELNKSILILEVGVRSENHAYVAPWIWNHGTGVNTEHQALYYQSVCNAWIKELDTMGLVNGIFWWGLRLKQHYTPAQDPGFNPLGKPAEKIIKTCFD